MWSQWEEPLEPLERMRLRLLSSLGLTKSLLPILLFSDDEDVVPKMQPRMGLYVAHGGALRMSIDLLGFNERPSR